MANIDDLNFGVHLDTKEFDARIQATLKTAKDLNISLTQMLDLQKKVKPVKINLTDIKKQGELERQNIRTKGEQDRQNIRTEASQRRYNKSVSDGNKSLREANNLMKGRVGWLGQMQNQLLGATSIYAAQRVLREMVNITGEFEKQKMALRAIVQDVDGADALYDKLQGLALESPFSFKELLSYGKQLSAFSVPLNELYDTTKMLADVSAGLGVSMDRIVLAYGQVRSAEFLRGTEVRQFTEAGIPILEELAKQFTELEGRAVSVGEVFDKISARQVPFEMVEKAFVDMTSEGGKFYQMQEVLAETLSGKISNLRDAYEKMYSEIGKSVDGPLKDAVDSATELMERWEDVGRVLVTLISTFGAYKAVLIATNALQRINAFGDAIKQVIRLREELGLLTAAQKAFNLASKANIYALIAAAIFGVVTAVRQHIKAKTAEEAAIDEANRATREEMTQVNNLANKLKDANLKESERVKILDELKAINPDIVEGLYDEADAVAVLTERLEEYNDARLGEMAIKRTSMEEDFDELTQSLADAKGEMADQKSQLLSLWTDLEAEMREMLKKGGLSRAGQDFFNQILESAEPAYDKALKVLTRKMQTFEDANKRGYVLDSEMYLRNDLDALYKNARVGKAGSNFLLSEAELKQAEENYKTAAENIRDKIIAIAQEVYKDDLGARVEFVQKQLAAYGLTDLWEQEGEAIIKQLEGWQKIVRDKLYSLGEITVDDKGRESAKYGLLPNPNNPDGAKYIDGLRERYAEIQKLLTDYGNVFDTQKEELLKEKSLIEALAGEDALNFSLIENKGGGSKDNKNPFQSYIDGLQAYIDKYEVYKQLVDEGFDKDLAYTLGFGLNATDGTDIEKKIDEAFSQALGKEINLDYGLGSKTILDQITEIVGKTEKLKDLQPIINDGEKQRLSYIEDEKEFAKEMLALIQKNKDYDEQIADVRERIKRAQESEYLTEEQQIQSIIALEDEELRLINEKANSLKKIQSIDLSEFWQGLTDVSVDNKLKDIWGYIDQLNQLQKLIDSGVGEKTFSKDSKLFKGLKITKEDARQFDLDENFITNLFGDNDELELTKANIKSIRTEIEKLNGIATDKSAIANFFRLLGQSGTGEGGKRTAQEIKNLKEAASGAIDEISELGGAFGELINALDADIDISWLADVAGIAKDILSEDWIGLAIKVLSMIADTINGNKEAAEAAAQATRDYAQAMQELRDAQTLEGYTSIFGTDDLGEAIVNYKIAQRELDEISNRILELKQNYELFAQMRERWQNGETEMFVMGSYENGKWVNDPYEGFDGKLTSDMRSDWHKFWGTKKSDIYTTNLYDYFDEKGMLDGEALQKWFDSYGEGLSDENKVLVQELLDDWNQYNAAMENVASYMSDIFGQVADDIADKFITAFMETGDAAVEMGDIVSNVAQQIAKDVIKAMLFEEIFDKLDTEKMAEDLAAGNVDSVLAVIAEAVENAEELAPVVTQLLEGLSTYVNAGESEGTTELTNNIQGITEDTAQLLASYINGIRADVSFSKTQRAQMIALLQTIASQNVPNLSDYLNNIQAYTYDIKMSSQAILDKLNNAWTEEDLGGFKVWMINN